MSGTRQSTKLRTLLGHGCDEGRPLIHRRLLIEHRLTVPPAVAPIGGRRIRTASEFGNSFKQSPRVAGLNNDPRIRQSDFGGRDSIHIRRRDNRLAGVEIGRQFTWHRHC